MIVKLSAEEWAALVSGVERGDRDSLELLYTVLQRGARYYIARHIQAQDVEDALHDCWICLTEAIQSGRVREPGRFAGYLHTTAWRRICQQIETNIQDRGMDSLTAASTRRAPGPNPEQVLMEAERRGSLDASFKGLKRRDREILARSLYEEASDTKLAMGLTETQYRLLKSRAKSRMAQAARQSRARWTGRGDREVVEKSISTA